MGCVSLSSCYSVNASQLQSGQCIFIAYRPRSCAKHNMRLCDLNCYRSLVFIDSPVSSSISFHSFIPGLLVCSVRLPSSIRGLATPWTYFLHFSLSSVILIESSTESPVHVLRLSIQAVRGLPRLRAPGIVPCNISFSRQLPCFLV